MEEIAKRGYLHEDFRLFHIRDQVELELHYHYHEFNKIVVFLSGKVTYVVEGKSYFLQPWDVLLVPRGQIHWPSIDPSEPYERIILWINSDYLEAHSTPEADLLQCFRLAEARKFALLRLEAAARPQIRGLLGAVEDALISREFGSDLWARSGFFAIHGGGQPHRPAGRHQPGPGRLRSDPKSRRSFPISMKTWMRTFPWTPLQSGFTSANPT